MSEEVKFEEALNRLDRALDSFEAAAVRAAEGNKSHQSLQGEVDFLRDDRSRLANELDSAQSRSRKLNETNEHIAARLEGVMHNIRVLLGAT
jgi:FtsZ-binding cell division protein ZapB